MGTVTIEESDDEKSIVTPDLRLRFRWVEDRWTHEIDVGPDPWKLLCVALATGGEGDVVPTFQDVHLQLDGEDVLALAVGQMGRHHFSASFRVQSQVIDVPNDHLGAYKAFLYNKSRVEIDIADRCVKQEKPVEVHYELPSATAVTFLGDEQDNASGEQFVRDWRDHLLWQVPVADSLHVSLFTKEDSSVSILDQEHSRWHVRVRGGSTQMSHTSRIRYQWTHERVIPKL